MENFSSEGKCQDSFQDTARFAGTEEDALHPAVLLSKTRSVIIIIVVIIKQSYLCYGTSAKDTYINTLHEVTMKIVYNY